MQLSLGFAPPLLRLAVLGSGSAGNALVIESDRQRLLVDAGFSCREIEKRLAAVGVDRRSVDAVLLTHEHGDHVRGVSRFARRNGARVYATVGTLRGTRVPDEVSTVPLRAGVEQRVGDLSVEPFSVVHDAREPVGFIVSDGSGRRIGIAADTGERPAGWCRLTALDVLVVEANHDPEMLRTGPYPWPLKQRVGGPRGHLSNGDAAAGVAQVACARLRCVVLYHLSRTNNLPALALEAMRSALDRVGCRAEVRVSSQFEPSDWIEVESGVDSVAEAVGVAV